MLKVPKCPKCQVDLSGRLYGSFRFYQCTQCLGEVFSLYQLKKILTPQAFNNIQESTQSSLIASVRPCSHCFYPMKTFTEPSSHVELDQCERCDVIWFDAGEKEQISSQGVPQVVEKLVVSETNILKFSTPRPATPRTSQTSGLKLKHYLMMLFGFPVELESAQLKRAPETTVALITLSAVASLLAFLKPDMFAALSFKVDSALWQQLLNSATVFLVHGDIWHLLGNMYFLYVFGDNVEGELGAGKYLSMIFLATVLGSLSYWFFFAEPKGVLVGASAGISAIMIFYMLRFPASRFALMFMFIPFKISARTMGILFVFKEVLGLYFQSQSLTHVSHISHVGGILVGWAYYIWYVGQNPQGELPDTSSGSRDF